MTSAASVDNVLHYIRYMNQPCTLPAIGEWRIRITPAAVTTTTFRRRTWTKSHRDLLTACEYACHKWRTKAAAYDGAANCVIDLAPLSEADAAASIARTTAISNNCAYCTLHPNYEEEVERGTLFAFNSSDVSHARTIGQAEEQFAIFFLDPQSLRNVEQCAAVNRKLTFVALYRNPYVYLLNCYENKADTWLFRFSQMEEVVEAVNNQYLRMMPGVIATAEDMEVHLYMYRMEKVRSVCVKNGGAPFGVEVERVSKLD